VLITLANFAGVAPKLAPFMLQPNQAQVASNTRLWTGALEALPATSTTKTGVNTQTKTIYRFGQDTPGDSNYWFTWNNNVHAVKGPIAGDVTERTYYTGDGFPRVTDNSIALSSAPYPSAGYRLGIPAPGIAPMAVVNGTGDTTETFETRAYVYTYVSYWGEEGQPSDPTLVDLYPASQTVTLTFGSVPTGNYNLGTIRVYRTAVGTSGTNYYFVSELTIANTTFNDDVSGTDLGEPLPSLSWAMPPADLKGLISLPNGFLAGFSGRDIYFSEAYYLHAWPIEYSQSVDYPIVALGQFGQSLVVLTTGSPYMLTGSDPSSMTLQKLDFEQSCLSAKSVSRLGNGVAYSSPDGLAYIGPDGMQILTDNFFTRKEWQTLKPETIIAAQHDGRYYAFFDDGTNKGGFILDPKSNGSPFVFTSQYYDGLYNDLRNDALYGVRQGSISKLEGSTSLLGYTWRSKQFLLPRPQNFRIAQVIAADYTSLTVKFYLDGELKYTATPTSQNPFKLPGGFRGRVLEVELSGTSTVIAAYVAESVEELKNV
jgi:hypothetical protein